MTLFKTTGIVCLLVIGLNNLFYYIEKLKLEYNASNTTLQDSKTDLEEVVAINKTIEDWHNYQSQKEEYDNLSNSINDLLKQKTRGKRSAARRQGRKTLVTWKTRNTTLDTALQETSSKTRWTKYLHQQLFFSVKRRSLFKENETPTTLRTKCGSEETKGHASP